MCNVISQTCPVLQSTSHRCQVIPIHQVHVNRLVYVFIYMIFKLSLSLVGIGIDISKREQLQKSILIKCCVLEIPLFGQQMTMVIVMCMYDLSVFSLNILALYMQQPFLTFPHIILVLSLCPNSPCCLCSTFFFIQSSLPCCHTW